MSRAHGRANNQPRNITITPNYIEQACGSVLIETGKTRVICTATIENNVPQFIRETGKGWLSAEYNMLPGSSPVRIRRERQRLGGRTQEIQRLIGRSLRSILNLQAIGPRTIWIDCDVIQADGGTRTASITGGFVALVLALRDLDQREKAFIKFPIQSQIAGVSLGICQNEILLDLDYAEDSMADVDLNIVMTDDLYVIEIQGTAEKAPFSRSQLTHMLDAAEFGLKKHFEEQLRALDGTLF